MIGEFQLFPEQASSFASEVDWLYAYLCGASGVMTLMIGVFILYLSIKYRRGSRANRAGRITSSVLLETIWIVGPMVIATPMFLWGAKIYFQRHIVPSDAIEISCVAKQWMWKFQHSSGKAEINDLHLPLGQPVVLRMISEDVIHSFYVPAFRVKQDVLPGRYTTIWFAPSKSGKYHLFCAEYCGAKHSQMGGVVYVLEPAKYQEWLAGDRTTTSPLPPKLLEQFRCVNCHQGGGTASRAPPLDDLFGKTVGLADGQSVVADENYIRESIMRPRAKIVAGYAPIMPSFEGQISEEGIHQIIAEIKALGGADRPRPGADQHEKEDRR